MLAGQARGRSVSHFPRGAKRTLAVFRFTARAAKHSAECFALLPACQNTRRSVSHFCSRAKTLGGVFRSFARVSKHSAHFPLVFRRLGNTVSTHKNMASRLLEKTCQNSVSTCQNTVLTCQNSVSACQNTVSALIYCSFSPGDKTLFRRVKTLFGRSGKIRPVAKHSGVVFRNFATCQNTRGGVFRNFAACQNTRGECFAVLSVRQNTRGGRPLRNKEPRRVVSRVAGLRTGVKQLGPLQPVQGHGGPALENYAVALRCGRMALLLRGHITMWRYYTQAGWRRGSHPRARRPFWQQYIVGAPRARGVS